ncbi:MAG: exodeoxyribonuclease V subunit alpha [Gammaproteobacteria bacterium]
MTPLLLQLARYGEISWLGYHFAGFIATQSGSDLGHPLCLTAARLCEANLEGSVCIDLAALADKPMFARLALPDAEVPLAPALSDWRALLLASDCAGEPGERAPMTLDGDLLYLNRFWHYEDEVAASINSLLTLGTAAADTDFGDLFGDAAEIDADQKQAVLNAASKPFSVISGGPGSGKTSTVVRILALLLARQADCRVALAAPTGKAAARMQDSILRRVDQLGLDDAVIEEIDFEATTLHRLLGYRGRTFVHDADNPLAVDCLIVDEASMIDLKLMYHLLQALPDDARLILLGDRDQLASVAAGNVLGDITGHGRDIETETAAVAGAVSLLRGNYRFAADSVIGQLAENINRGRSDTAIELLSDSGRGLKWWQPEDEETIEPEALEWICDAYLPIFDCSSAQAALEVYESTRVLCAVNQGPLGVETVGRRISESLLARAGLPPAELYPGLPIMITRNHYELGLYNGDSGILWREEAGLHACFRSEGGIRSISINRLPAYTPAWTSTVHKSQGSEYDSVLMILPSDPDSEVLSRELLYTAVTRARQNFLLQAARPALSAAVAGLTRRHSGLARKLGWSA